MQFPTYFTSPHIPPPPLPFPPPLRSVDSGYHGCGDAIEPYNVQNIVCQPILQGGLIVFSHRLLHWGSNPLRISAAAAAITVPPVVPVPSLRPLESTLSIGVPLLPLSLPLKRIRIAFSCAFADQSYEVTMTPLPLLLIHLSCRRRIL